MRITRLGEGVDRTRRIRSEAIARTIDVLREYRAIVAAEQVERLRLVATSAVRDASDGDKFLESAKEIMGVQAELLSGEEEGRLSYLGATDELADDGRTFVVVDIGGGSTEIVLRPERIILTRSMDMGCVRLTERFLPGDPPREAEISAAVAAIGSELDRAVSVLPALKTLGPRDQLVGLAGTLSTLAMLNLDLVEYDRTRVHHAVLSRVAVENWCSILATEPMAIRARRASIPVGRRDVIFGGALILREVMRRLGVNDCLVSEADILDGLVLSLLRESDGFGR